MYHCFYCNIILKKESEKTFEEHEVGYRHQMNKILFFKKKYNFWLKKKNLKKKSIQKQQILKHICVIKKSIKS